MEKRTQLTITALILLLFNTYLLGIITSQQIITSLPLLNFILIPLATMFLYFIYQIQKATEKLELPELSPKQQKILELYSQKKSFRDIQKELNINLNDIRRTLQQFIKNNIK